MNAKLPVRPRNLLALKHACPPSKQTAEDPEAQAEDHPKRTRPIRSLHGWSSSKTPAKTRLTKSLRRPRAGPHSDEPSARRRGPATAEPARLEREAIKDNRSRRPRAPKEYASPRRAD